MEFWITVVTGTLCVAWVIIYLMLMYSAKKLAYFEKLQSAEPEQWPKLSVIVPACNESEHIEKAAKSLIDQDYPALEIIFVNDRSSDNTGEIIDRLAGENPVVKSIHIKELPENWLGKVHALAEATKQASGDWLLFTDADIVYAPGILRKAVAYSCNREIDHLALMPDVEIKSFWLSVAIHSFGLLFLLATRAASVNKPGSKAVIGIGAFNLVKKLSFDKTPGFDWLRMETVDDMGIGLMMKQSGGQTHFAIADKELKLGWYDSVSAMFNGLEKNLFGAGPGYSVLKLLAQVLLIWCLVAAPIVGLFAGNDALFLLVCVVVILQLGFSVFFVRKKQSESWSLLLFPLGMLLLTAMMIRAAYKCIKNGGIIWRGTFYSTARLRAGQRVRL